MAEMLPHLELAELLLLERKLSILSIRLRTALMDNILMLLQLLILIRLIVNLVLLVMNARIQLVQPPLLMVRPVLRDPLAQALI